MADSLKIYGIKNCDTVKKALKFLSSQSLPHEFIDFRENLISEDLYKTMEKGVGLELLINKRSATYRSLTDNEKQNIDYELVSKYPTLIKRPVLIQNEDVMVGFSEKKYLELLL